jgi:hypothetical protein
MFALKEGTMARQTIRDQRQKIIGYIEDTHDGQRALHHTLRILGYYRARDNYTRDASLKLVGPDNQLMALIDRAR